MRILELEQKYSELKSDLGGQQSKRTKLLKISEDFGFVLSVPLTNPNLIEPYIIDLIPDFIKYSSDLEIRGLNSKRIKLLKDQLVQIKNLNLNGIESLECDKVIQSLENKIQLMNDWLNSVHSNKDLSKIYFPLLEKYGDDFGAGYLETVNVVIQKGEKKFNISPSGLENDEQLEKQIQLCFEKALEYCSQYIKKIKKTHTVYIHFENRLGILTGNSLGAALTLLFIEALLKHYNSTTIVNVSKNLAITGGIDQNSRIIATSKAIIGAKVESVFYSDVEIMCVPKIDEMWAEEKLKELQAEYPKRNLKIIGLIDLNDLFDRRQIVDIRKQKLIVRSGKFVKKNWISSVTTVLLAMVFAYLYVMDYDDNPAFLSTQGEYLLIKNKNGKVLWAKNVKYPSLAAISSNFLNSYSRIYDINRDGLNEVLIAGAIFDSTSKIIDNTSLTCFDSDGNQFWQFKFKEEVLSKRENLGKFYSITIIDTVTINNKLLLYLIASNQSTFSSAIFPIDISDGEKCAGTFWCSGHTNAGVIKDFNSNGKPDIIAAGVDNGYEQQVLFAFEIDTLNVSRRSIDDYFIFNYPEAKTLAYLRFPKTDIDIFYNTRIPGIDQKSFFYDEAKQAFRFTTVNDDIGENAHLWIEVSKNIKDVNIIVDNQYRVVRDTLVAQGKLNPPLTDTEEYKQIYKDNILYLQKGKWVKREDLK